jgi:CRP-like cAMP-binding protein
MDKIPRTMSSSRHATSHPKAVSLADLALFHGFEMDELRRLEPLGERLSLQAGALMIEEKKPQPYLYVILDGHCEIFVTREGKRSPIVTMEGGEMVGEMAVLNPPHSTAGVIALTEVEAWRLSREQFREFLDSSPDAGAKLMKLMARTFAQRL